MWKYLAEIRSYLATHVRDRENKETAEKVTKKTSQCLRGLTSLWNFKRDLFSSSLSGKEKYKKTLYKQSNKKKISRQTGLDFGLSFFYHP